MERTSGFSPMASARQPHMDRTGQHFADLGAACLLAATRVVVSVPWASLLPAMVGMDPRGHRAQLRPSRLLRAAVP